ncbi:hypothetical protein [Anaeromyxobacter sp. PSR-1]|uniref:hypothetical protein n=1 Tax=Anaeromyxobacter sp. PSR-1 TaxID=1300915 RepID=UPI000750A53A|nr:hypothetical protein [Anaeromyxobacter sp. PSR-1]
MPVDAEPPTTVLGFRLTPDGPITRTESDAVAAIPACVEVIVTLREEVTVLVDTGNVTAVAPASIVTAAGTVATATLLLESADVIGTVTGPLSESVPVARLPPPTIAGARLRLTARMVSVADRATPPPLAEIEATVSVVMRAEPTGNVARVAPAGTVTLAGTVAAPLELLSWTVVPDGPAGPVSATSPVVPSPSTTAVAASVTDWSTGAVTVSVAEPITPESVAVMVVVPAASADARPVALIEAVAGAEDVQVTCVVRSRVELSE